jgi:hypothetical protein
MIYLASPYSAVGVVSPDEAKGIRHSRYCKTMAAQAALFGAGYPVFATIVHTHVTALAYNLPTDAAFWMSYNHHMIDLCKAVFILQLDGWLESAGVGDELGYAYQKDINVFRIEITDETDTTMMMHLPIVPDLCLRKTPIETPKLHINVCTSVLS